MRSVFSLAFVALVATTALAVPHNDGRALGHADEHAARAIHANFAPRQDPAETESAPGPEETGDPAEPSTGVDPSTPVESISQAVESITSSAIAEASSVVASAQASASAVVSGASQSAVRASGSGSAKSVLASASSAVASIKSSAAGAAASATETKKAGAGYRTVGGSVGLAQALAVVAAGIVGGGWVAFA